MWWMIFVCIIMLIGFWCLFGSREFINLVVLILCVISFWGFLYLTMDVLEEAKEEQGKITLYNEKKESELLEKELDIPSKYILVEKDKDDYLKVTSEKGIYIVQFDYDKDKKIKSLKKVIQIESRVQ